MVGAFNANRALGEKLGHFSLAEAAEIKDEIDGDA
jgi:hypothetical protein